MLHACVRAFGNRKQMIILWYEKRTALCGLLHKDHTCMWHSLWQGEFTPNREQAQPPRVSPHYCFVGGVKFPQGEGSAVIHRKKNDLLHKDAICLCHEQPLEG